MWIVVEGCDCTGKTTFVEALRTEIEKNEARSKTPRKVRVIHHGPPTKHPLDEYELDYADYTPDGDHIISDRLHFGELVYGPIYRGETRLGVAGLSHVDKFLQARGAVVVLLDQAPDEVKRRMTERGEDYLQDIHVDDVLHAFRTVASRSSNDVITLRDPGRQEVLGVALRGALEESIASELQAFSTYVGPHEPRYLLLGDVRADKRYPSAFVPHASTSGRYLLEALTPAIRNEAGIANATEEDVEALWETLGRPRTIALGNNARDILATTKIPHGKVPHPQWWRRFKYSQQNAYGWQISRELHKNDE